MGDVASPDRPRQTVHKHVQHLVEKGHLRKASHRSRSVEPVEETAGPVVSLPLLGSVAAGAPIEAIEDSESIDVPQHLVPRRARCFVLRVRGDSMIDDHICHGDVILLERVDEVRDGDIVVALVAGSETTLKRFYREAGGRVRLQPANSALEPIVVPSSEVQIQGRLLAVLRKYK